MSVQLHVLLTWPAALVATAALLLPLMAAWALKLHRTELNRTSRTQAQQQVREGTHTRTPWLSLVVPSHIDSVTHREVEWARERLQASLQPTAQQQRE